MEENFKDESVNAKPYKYKKILVLINPLAGKKTTNIQSLNLIKDLSQIGGKISIYYTKFKKDASRIIKKYAYDYDLVVCCGGDGTFHEVVNGMMCFEKKIPIGYIPTGTTNDLAKSLNLPKTIHELTALISKCEPKNHDIGLFNGNEYFSYVASFGAFSEVSYSTPQKIKNILGHFAYILTGIGSIKKIRPYHLKINYDGNVIEDDFIFCAVINSKSIGGVIEISGNDIDLGDGKLEIFLIRNLNNPIDLYNALKEIKAKEYNKDSIILLHARNIIIENQKKVPWTLDGEYAGKLKNVNIANIHSGIKVIKN